MLQGQPKYLFPGNNTSRGFISHYHDGLKGLEHIFILKGGPGTGKSTLIRKIGNAMMERGYDVEFWQCSSDNDSLDGVVVPALSVAVIDGTPPHNMDPRYPGAVEEIVDLGKHWNAEILRENRKSIIRLTDNISADFAQAYEKLAQAGIIAQEKQNEAIPDTFAIEKATEKLAADIFAGHLGSRHLFSSAMTPKGYVSVAENLSHSVSRRWLLWGPSGCGKEILLEKLAALAEAKGHYAEIYHPALLLDNIELLLLPGLDIAVWDHGETQPTEVGENDIIMDCSNLSQSSVHTDNKEIEELLAAAAETISHAKELHDKLEKHYSRAMDFEGIDREGTALFDRILTLAAKEK